MKGLSTDRQTSSRLADGGLVVDGESIEEE